MVSQLEKICTEQKTKSRNGDLPCCFSNSTGHVPPFPIIVHIYSTNTLMVAYATDGMQNNKIMIAGTHLEIIDFLISTLHPAVISERN